MLTLEGLGLDLWVAVGLDDLTNPEEEPETGTIWVTTERGGARTGSADDSGLETCER